MSRQEEFHRRLEAAVMQAASERNVALDLRNADSRPEEQVAQVDELIASRVNALIIVPVDAEGVSPAVEAANSVGVPVVSVGAAPAAGEVVCRVVSDEGAGGRLAGEFLREFLGGRGEVAVLGGPAIAAWEERLQGFREAIAPAPRMTLALVADAGVAREGARDSVGALLAARPDLRGIFAAEEALAIETLAALEAANRQESVALVGWGAAGGLREAVQRGGALKASVERDPDALGRAAVEMAVGVLDQHRVPPTAPVAMRLFTKDDGP